MMEKKLRYFEGLLAEYTGKVEGLFYELLMLEGHSRGELRFTIESPSEINSEDKLKETE